MLINLQVTYADGTKKEVAAGASDIVAFESKFDLSIARLEQNIKLTHLFFLAWHAEHRKGETKDTFEKWLESIELVEAAETKK